MDLTPQELEFIRLILAFVNEYQVLFFPPEDTVSQLELAMDVKRGHCWRCERTTQAQSHICSHCEIATYCREKCRRDDQYRHKPECEVWGPKKCNNPLCSQTGRLKEVGLSRPMSSVENIIVIAYRPTIHITMITVTDKSYIDLSYTEQTFGGFDQ